MFADLNLKINRKSPWCVDLYDKVHILTLGVDLVICDLLIELPLYCERPPIRVAPPKTQGVQCVVLVVL